MTSAGYAPSVSVVVPTCDRPELVRSTVEAVLSQDYAGDIECLVVYDRSRPDLSLQRGGRHRSVRVLTNERAPGPAGARNTGFMASGGEFLATCDDDDLWMPDKLRQQITLHERDRTALVMSTGIRIASGSRSIDRPLPSQRIRHADLLRSRVMEAHQSTIVFHRSLLDSVGPLDEGLTRASIEDYDWVLRATKTHDIFGVVEPKVVIRWHPGSFYAGRWRTMTEATLHLLRNHPDLRSDRRGAARLYGQLAVAYAAQGARLEAKSWIGRALRADWRQPRAYIACAVVAGVLDADRASRTVRAFGRGI